MPQYANADRIVVRGFWKDEVGGGGVPGATVTFDPVPLTQNTTGTPNLRDLTAYGHLKLRQMVANVDPTSGYYAAIVVSNNDPDLDAYLGRRVTFSGESPFTIAVPYNAPSTTVDAPMAAAIPELTVGQSVKAIWLVEAALVDGTPPPPISAYMNSTQTLSAIATAIGTVRQVPSGGNAGQVVTKTSDAYAWADPPAGGGGGGSYTAENARDDVGAALRVTGGGSVALDDAADTITIAVDLPEATQTARTAAIGTPTDLLKLTSRYDTSGGAISQPLPAATAGRVLAIGLDAGTNALTLTANGSDVIGSGSATSLALALAGEVRTLHCTTAGRWRVISGNTPASAYSVVTVDGTKVDTFAVDSAPLGLSDVDGLSAALSAKLATADAPELIRDTMGVALVAGANTTITPNDAGDQIVIASSGGGGGGGGGGSAAPVFQKKVRSSGNISFTGSDSWQNLDTGLDLSLPAVVGNTIEVSLGAYMPRDQDNWMYLAAVTLGSDGNPSHQVHDGTAELNNYAEMGAPSWLGFSHFDAVAAGSYLYTLLSSDIVGGNVTIRFRARQAFNNIAKAINATADCPVVVWARNLG